MNTIRILQVMLSNLGIDKQRILSGTVQAGTLTQLKATIMLKDRTAIKIEAVDSEMTSRLVMVQDIADGKKRYQHYLIDEDLSEAAIDKIPIHIARLMIRH